ncbi:MAG: ATP phosphoribosyltransferase regulatory subunit [Nanoarchaeota archaeon]
MKTEIVKGFNDFTGEDAVKRAEIKKILVEIFEKYGFEPAETPLVEYEEFVKGDNEKDEAVSDIFKLQDKGKRKLALRYEFTFQLKRLMQNRKLPYKRYQIGEVFRDEPTSANRFRQFTQCDVDIIGSTAKDEAEILALASEVMKELGINGTIFVNNRKLLNEILSEQKVKNNLEVIKELDKLGKLSEKEIKANLKKYDAEKILGVIKKPESYFKKYESYKEIQELKKYCDIYGVKINFQPSLARGLAYYNGNVFEIKTNEAENTITAGGSYMFNNVQSTGISFGLDRLSNFAKLKFEEDTYLVVSLNQNKEAIKLAQNLRSDGKSVAMCYGKPSKALEYANSYDIAKVIFVGEKEVKAKTFKIKDMKSGKENELKI